MKVVVNRLVNNGEVKDDNHVMMLIVLPVVSKGFNGGVNWWQTSDDREIQWSS